MVEGESGLLASSHPHRKPIYEPSKRRVTWPNGAIGTLYSAERPDLLRGPQHDGGWADETAAWRYDRDTWDQLQFGMRLGQKPRIIVTTTPRPTALVKELIADPATALTRGSTFANIRNLAKSYVTKLLRKYKGTRLGRQELYAEVLDDNQGALWKRVPMLDALRVSSFPEFIRVVVAVDPAVSSKADSAETGIVVAGLGVDGHAYVLNDSSLRDTPGNWGAAVVAAYHLHKADRVVGEVNNGGDLVESNIRTADRNVSYKAVRASRGKQTRAEPVAALYEQKRVHHVGVFAELEDQLCDWDPTTGADSPDRLDALVWAITELMLGSGGDDDEGISVIRTSSR